MVDAPRLNGRLGSADGDIPLLGKFKVRRDTGAVLARIDQQTLPPPLREHTPFGSARKGLFDFFARGLDHWTTRGHFEIEFQDIAVEFDQEGRSVQQASYRQSGGTSGSASIRCAELLDRIDHFTLDCEYAIDELGTRAKSLRRTGGSEQLIRVLWLQGLLCLSLGQADKGLTAVSASVQVARKDSISVAATAENNNLCSDLARQLQAIGERETAGRVAKMVSRS